jgi:hypothetical protein
MQTKKVLTTRTITKTGERPACPQKRQVQIPAHIGKLKLFYFEYTLYSISTILINLFLKVYFA